MNAPARIHKPFNLVVTHPSKRPRKAKRVPLPSHPPRDSVPAPSLPPGPTWGKRDPLLAKNLGHVVRDATPWHLREPVRMRAGAAVILAGVLVLLGAAMWGTSTGGTNANRGTNVYKLDLP